MTDFAKLHGSMDPKNDAQWFTYEGTDSEFFIAPLNNPSLQTAAMKTTKAGEEVETLNLYDIQKPMIDMLVKYVLLDWKNVTVDGVEWVYKEKAAEFLMTYLPVSEWIQERAGELDDKMANHLDSMKKKSKKR